MNPLHVNIVPKYSKLGEGFSRREIAESFVHPGRRTDGSQSEASWITDLIDLKKVILLCAFCRVKFSHRKSHYRKLYVADWSGNTDGYMANGMCDSCKQQTVNCGGGTAYVHESEYNKTCVDPLDARRKARARAGAMSAWRFINRQRS